MGIEYAGAALGTKRFQRPFIRFFIMTEDVSIAVIGSDTEIYGRRPVPLILDGFDKQHGIAKPKLNGALVGLVTGITFDAKLHGAF
jgi:hypothetical protein